MTTEKRRPVFVEAVFTAVLALAASLVLGGGNAWAVTEFLGDGAQQNGPTGGWDLPTQGSCLNDATKTTRPACLALRLDAGAAPTQATCTAASPNGAWSTSGVCNDLVHTTDATCLSTCNIPAFTDQPTCEEGGGIWVGRVWNPPNTTFPSGICAIAMEEQDRNAVICARDKGNWVTSGTCVGVWVFPAASSYIPPLLTSTAPAGTGASSTGPGPGDQCLRCHNAYTQYNGSRVRDVEDVLYMGHRNMARKVTAGNAWGGPPLQCTIPVATSEEACEEANGSWYPVAPYPTDSSGNVFNWFGPSAGTITVGGVDNMLYWIYGDWLSPLPRAIYSAGSSASTGKPLMSYSCGRCHTTGWTSDSAIQDGTGGTALKEPEASFPGVTWDGVTLNTTGKVNLAGNVSGDPNLFSSWNQFGIHCSRCHSSAVNNTGGPLPYSAPAGMSTHHSNLTITDIPGSCTPGSAGRSKTACEANGGTWNFTGYCTDSRFSAKTQCEAGPEPAPGSGVGVWLAPCSNGTSGNEAACMAALGTWTEPTATSCTVAGLCNNIAGGPYTTEADCLAAPAGDCPGGVTCQWAATSDVISCMDAGGHYTGSATNRGPIIAALCLQCHRQETGGMPYADTGSGAGSGSTTHPGSYVKIGPYHSTVTFPSHPHGNMFLNSPHGQFTGTFNQIPTATFGNGYYSFFQNLGEASNTGNACTGCHNPHRSTVEEAGVEDAVEECTACHNKNLGAIKHAHGVGTPLENAATDPASACETCHMPGGVHMFRINTDASYSTFPPEALTTITNANTAPDGGFANAVWVDLDAACGQCHGGGMQQANTTLTTSASTATLPVASTDGFQVGQRITVADAGNFEYDDQGGATQGDFETYIVSMVAGTPGTLTVVGAPPFTAAEGAAVIQNPTRNNAGYLTKTELAGYAKGIHNDEPMVSFSYALGSPNTLMVTVFAAAVCNGPCNVYDWDWGDGSPHGSGITASHTYATAGPKLITLTVEQFGVGEGSAQKIVNVYTPDFGPTADGTACGAILSTTDWSASLTDSSTDDNAVSKVTVVWGDGSLLAAAGQGATFTHTYRGPGTYNLVQTALDALGQQSIRRCSLSVKYFTIRGTVETSDIDGNNPVASAQVTVRNSTTMVTAKITYTAANGTFSAGSLPPGTYDLTVTKSGYVFDDPAATITVGPSPGNFTTYIIKSTIP
jgi:predicted CXXCH cytochrome family protein